MKKENKKLLQKLGHPIMDWDINEEFIETHRRIAWEDLEEFKEENPPLVKLSDVVEQRWIEVYTLYLLKESIGRSASRLNGGGEYDIDYCELISEGYEGRIEMLDKLTKMLEGNEK